MNASSIGICGISLPAGTLGEEGLLAKEPYREPGARQRYEYTLTEKGLDLYPAVVALMQWGDRWAAHADGPPVELRHRGCGEALSVEVRCAAGHGPLSAREAEVSPGAGARAA